MHDRFVVSKQIGLILPILVALVATGARAFAQAAPVETPPAGVSATPVPTAVAAPADPAAPMEDAPADADNSAQNSTGRGRTKYDTTKKSSKRASKGHDDYMEPLRFDPEDNGLSIDNPQFKWWIEPSGTINIGGLKIAPEIVTANVSQVQRDKTPARFDGPKEKYVTNFAMTWPQIMTRTGDLTIEDAGGKVLWTKKITEVERNTWASDLKSSGNDIQSALGKSSWGMLDISKDQFPFFFRPGRLRFCLFNKNSEIEHLKLCSPSLEVQVASGGRMRTVAPDNGKEVASTFMLNNKLVEPTGLANFPIGQPITMRMNFKTGAFFEMASQPADPQILDVVQGPNPGDIVLTGIGSRPLGDKIKVLSRPITHFWAPTGFPQELVWQIVIPADSPTVRVIGAYHVPFLMLFTFDRLPKESDRVYVKKTRSSGTYSSSPTVEGYSPSGSQLQSDEYSSRKIDPYHFEWSFAAPNKGKENRAHILIKTDDSTKPWVAHYRMYRSYPIELSARMTGILESDFTVIAMGEVSAAAWFETLGGIQNSVVSKQRWGIAARYLKALTEIQSASGVNVSDFQVANIDLKYNILPGIWHRDEIVGAMISAEKITVSGISSSLAGVGVYWARTMPRIFNDIFNIVPVFEYPKYVDMEFIYLPFALDSSIPGNSFNLNFHGRVFWTHRVYGEAGFGIRQYNFSEPAVRGVAPTANLSTAYGTFGIGMVF